MTPLSVVVLTYNEEPNIRACIESAHEIAGEIIVVDSGSQDRTSDIACQLAATVIVHPFEGYAAQRNWILRNVPFKNDWVLFLDADEKLSDPLKSELIRLFSQPINVDGFYIKRRLLFGGKWIKRGGYYPIWILRLFKHAKASCEVRRVNEHFVVSGETGQLTCDIIHEDLKGVAEWIARHNKYSTLEAMDLIEFHQQAHDRSGVQPSFWAGQVSRKRWLRERVWNRLPPLLRPFVYFSYRYFVRGGILDGTQGFIYHFLQGLWFPFLTDVKYLEALSEPKAYGARATSAKS